MTVLLDTHVWLWMITAPERLSAVARRLVEDGRTTLLLSAASSWEIAIKHSLGRLDLPLPPPQFVPERIRTTRVTALSIDHAHTLRAGGLEPHHRDPFDRMLVAQALVEKVPLLTADRVFNLYEVETLPAT